MSGPTSATPHDPQPAPVAADNSPAADSAESSPLRVRLWAALIAAGCAGVLAIATRLTPDPRGFGTHQQLAFPDSRTGQPPQPLLRFAAAPCGMLVVTGLPCPTCGMTTAFAHTVRGQFVRAFWAQPTGLLLALATVATLLGAIRSLITGRPPRLGLSRINPYRLFVLLLVLLVGGWAFKLATGLATGVLPVRSMPL